jgi:hypothetical protein
MQEILYLNSQLFTTNLETSTLHQYYLDCYYLVICNHSLFFILFKSVILRFQDCKTKIKGKFIFSYVIDFLPIHEFDKIINKYKGNYWYTHLSSYNHLLRQFFGQLSTCNSLRDICLCLKAHEKWLYHLCFHQTVNESSLLIA